MVKRCLLGKKGQLGLIEFQYLMGGLVAGLIGGLVLIYLSAKEIIGFKVPVVCGSFFLNRDRKGQLGVIEFKFFMYGLFVGIIGALVLVYLGTTGVIPFTIPVC